MRYIRIEREREREERYRYTYGVRTLSPSWLSLDSLVRKGGVALDVVLKQVCDIYVYRERDIDIYME